MNSNQKRSLMLLAILLCAAAISAGPTETPRRIEIVARRFSYEPSAITLKKGQPVILVLRSNDVTHGLTIKELGVNTELKKRHIVEVAVTPSETGRLVGKCSHFCGEGHGSMALEVDVIE